MSVSAAERERDRRAVHAFIQTIPDDDDTTTVAATTPKSKGKKGKAAAVLPVLLSKEDQDVEDAMEDEELDTAFVFDSTRAGGGVSSGGAASWSFNAMKKNAVKQTGSNHLSLDEKIRQRIALRRLEGERVKVEDVEPEEEEEKSVVSHRKKKKKKT
jgi:hypothetical protein